MVNLPTGAPAIGSLTGAAAVRHLVARLGEQQGPQFVQDVAEKLLVIPARVAAIVRGAALRHLTYQQVNIDVLRTVSDQVLQTITLSLVSVTSVLLAVLVFGLPVRPPAARRVACRPTQTARRGRP
jgi:hypothetical protein